MKSFLKFETVAEEMVQKLTGLVAVTGDPGLTLAPGYCLPSNFCRHQAHTWCIYLYKGKTLVHKICNKPKTMF